MALQFGLSKTSSEVFFYSVMLDVMGYKKHLKSIRDNRALQALLFGNSLILISLGMLVPIYALFVEEIGGNALSAGVTAGALAFASALSALVSGKLIDRFSPNQTYNFLVTGWTLIGISALIYLLVNSVVVLFLVQIFTGFVKTISAPAFDTLYARHLDKGSTGQEYGLWEASFFITSGIGSVAGGLLVTSYGFNGVFLGMALLAFLAAGYIAFLPRNTL